MLRPPPRRPANPPVRYPLSVPAQRVRGWQAAELAVQAVPEIRGNAIVLDHQILAVSWIMDALDRASIVSAVVVGLAFAAGEWLRQRRSPVGTAPDPGAQD